MKRNKKGFTIVELVIVIAVIAILSAILIPTFVNLTDKAQKSALQSDLSSVYSMYTSEAADGVLDSDSSVKMFLAKQGEVVLEKDSKNYVFAAGEDGKEVWKERSSVLTAEEKGYGAGKYGYVAFTTDPLAESAANSVWGGYTVYFYHVAEFTGQ